MKKLKLEAMVHTAVLITLGIILTRFCSIQTPVVRIGFGFVPLAVCGMLYGPFWAAAAGGIADFMGAVLFPSGAYIPGITVSAILYGLVFGLLLYRRETGWSHILLAAFINCMGISLFVTTLWLSLFNETPYGPLLVTRLLQNVVMLPIQFVVIRLLQKPVFSLMGRRLSSARK